MLLDTDHVSLLQLGLGPDAQRLRERLSTVESESVSTTIVTYEEQSRGWLARVSRANTMASLIDDYGHLERHANYYKTLELVAFDESAAVTFQRLRKLKLRIGTMDLRIASIALARAELLLTRNRVDFEKVPGLRFEDWTR